MWKPWATATTRNLPRLRLAITSYWLERQDGAIDVGGQKVDCIVPRRQLRRIPCRV